MYEPESRLKVYFTPSVPGTPSGQGVTVEQVHVADCDGASGSVALTSSRVVTSTPVGLAAELPACSPVSFARNDSSSLASKLGSESAGVYVAFEVYPAVRLGGGVYTRILYGVVVPYKVRVARRREMVDLTWTHVVALVHLHRYLSPCAPVPREADDVHRVRTEKLRQRAPIEHDGVRRASESGAETRAGG